MTPYKITCVTCQARLAVRSASLVGQILACPKCGSMVQVTAPANHGAADTAASTAIVAMASIAPADAALSGNSFEDVADIGAELASPAPASNSTVRPAPPQAAVANPARAATGLGTTKLLAIGLGSALVGSALVAAALSLLRSAPVDAPAAPMAPAATNSASSVAPPRAAPPQADDAATAVEPAVAPEADATTDVAPAPVAADDNPFEPATEPPAPPVPPGTEPAIPDATAAATAPATAPGDADAPRLRIDPLEFDPEGLDLATLMDGGHAAPPDGELALNDLEAEPAAPVESEAAEEDDSAAPVPAGAGRRPEDEEADVEPPAAPEVLLARRIAGVKIADMPLCRFLDFATALSAVPVSVAPAELRLAAASAATPVSVDVQDATIEQILAAALKPLRLAPVVENGQIVLRRAGEDRRRELAYPVDDLIDAQLGAAELAKWVERFVAPESWLAGGGAGRITVDGQSLRIDSQERVGYETILFLEQYRTARGLAPRSKYPASLLRAWAAKGELATRLGAPATFTFSRPTALREIFRWWQEESDTAVLVDWPALAEQRLAPHSRALASAAAQPWGAGMTAALAPLGLDWRPVDARTIEITTLVRMQSEPVLEMYRLVDAADRKAGSEAALRARVAKLADAAALDAAHGVLIVRQASEAQRRLADWLVAEGLLGPTGTAARLDATANPAAVSE